MKIPDKIVKTRKEVLPILDVFYAEYKPQLLKTITVEEVGEDSLLRIDGLWILNLLYTYRPFLEHISWHDSGGPVRYEPGERVDHSDQFLLAWLIQKLAQDRNLNVFGYYDHVVVDEVQDLMPVQLALLDTLHNNSMTLVGDVSQRIFALGVDSWDQLPVTINSTYELTMCHRSTLQTHPLCQRTAGRQRGQYIFNKGGETRGKAVSLQGCKPYRCPGQGCSVCKGNQGAGTPGLGGPQLP